MDDHRGDSEAGRVSQACGGLTHASTMHRRAVLATAWSKALCPQSISTLAQLCKIFTLIFLFILTEYY